ncbi:MAG: hypothetical protein E5X74_14425 [Mesorhizobium sp.]|uniref:iron transporter n=1 Tax=Mesorhizobium sp. TaxID=1871066 RepID=UPI000FE84305|nr:iron transporter [Mesorhizobium sp.]RWM28564.1 MAG: hypothetical protein EOR74_09595 [Mesorhizobium sp.]TIO76935.1 MAG: hypothetical protein E5X75_12310 [Mesorhizobium sp.]TIO84744.1 MAG: hypothetical protein E5X74_14425 [Mesorhizobium sp.]
MPRQLILFSSTVALLAGASGVCAMEYPIGKPQLTNGMEIGAVYLQPIETEPTHMMKPAADTDIHLEADIHAMRGNANGFAEGDWIPNLKIEYLLTRLDDNRQAGGVLMPMVASDGPHYGDNVKLMGPGKYSLNYTISFGESGGHSQFGRHVDKETGVAAWPEPFHVEYQFTFAGVGKKGGY